MNQSNFDTIDSVIKHFLDKNKQQLINIFIKERESRGDGILHILKNTEQNKIDVIFLNYEQIPEELKNEIMNKKQKSNKKNIIYFYITDNKTASVLEVNLVDTNTDTNTNTNT